MNLITVIPIARGIGKEYLTYFSTEKPPLGSLVEVPLRSRSIMALVSMVEPAKNKKTEIKNLPFGMKRMERIAATEFLLPTFIEAVHDIAQYYASTTGAVLSTLLPKSILESIGPITKNQEKITQENKDSLSTSISDISAIQADNEERFGSYKSLIREEFARNKSVFIVVPSREEIRTLQRILSKGIDPYTHILHTGLSKKEIVENWKKILASEHPVLIIATGYFLSLPRLDISTIIVENEQSRGFSVPSRPYLDIRMVAEIIAKKSATRLIYGASILRVETMHRIKENDIAEFGVLKFRATSTAECILADMRKPKEFVVIGETLSKSIETSIQQNDSTFLLCARKGLSSITVCGDCGHTLSCKNCGAPTVLYKKKIIGKDAENAFICRRCGEKSEADVSCENCGSWKLIPLGIGIETVEKELAHLFPDTTVFIMDKDHVKTHTQAETLMNKFTNKKGSILLGTELALPYLNKIEFSGVVSIDSLFAIPEFRMNEKIMDMLVSLRAVTEKKMIVQSRRPDEKVFEYSLRGNLSDFYRDEIAERKRFGYPPFNTFIKISLDGKRAEIRSRMEKTRDELHPFDLNIFESQISSPIHTVHGLIIIPRNTWPDNDLLQKLLGLSPEFTVKVDPESLL